MKELFCSMFTFLSLAACTGADTIKGAEYKLVEPPYAVEITLGFDEKAKKYHGKALNYYFGEYRIKGKTIEFLYPASTRMAGPVDQMNAENAYFGELNGKMNFDIKDNKLILKNKDNKELVFEKTASKNSDK